MDLGLGQRLKGLLRTHGDGDGLHSPFQTKKPVLNRVTHLSPASQEIPLWWVGRNNDAVPLGTTSGDVTDPKTRFLFPSFLPFFFWFCYMSLKIFFPLFLVFLPFLGQLPQHMEVPRQPR